MRPFPSTAGILLALSLVTGCGGTSQGSSCTDLCSAMADFATQLRVSSPVGTLSECQLDCGAASPRGMQAAIECVDALEAARPEERVEMLDRMHGEPPLFQ
jgi:hypothetical protein